MDIDYEMLGKDRVVITLKDFENMLDVIAYDEVKAQPEESFPSALTVRILNGEHPLKVFRSHRGLSQTQLSEKTGVAQAQISEIERGHKTGSVSSLHAIAQALDISIDDLILKHRPHK